MTMVGSKPPSSKIREVREVVVVFPCVPAIVTAYFNLASSTSISIRVITGIFFFNAATTSGLFLLIAVDITTTSESFILAALCPIKIIAPIDFKWSVTSVFFKSEPETL